MDKSTLTPKGKSRVPSRNMGADTAKTADESEKLALESEREQQERLRLRQELPRQKQTGTLLQGGRPLFPAHRLRGTQMVTPIQRTLQS